MDPLLDLKVIFSIYLADWASKYLLILSKQYEQLYHNLPKLIEYASKLPIPHAESILCNNLNPTALIMHKVRKS